MWAGLSTYKKITPSIDKLSLPVVPRPQCNHMVGNVVYDKTVHSVPRKQNLFGHTNKIQLIIPILKKLAKKLSNKNKNKKLGMN